MSIALTFLAWILSIYIVIIGVVIILIGMAYGRIWRRK